MTGLATRARPELAVAGSGIGAAIPRAKIYIAPIRSMIERKVRPSAIRKSTVSISGWTYAAITYGPVPDDFQTLLADATSLGIQDYEFDRSQDGELSKVPVLDPEQSALPVLSEEERQTVREAIAKLGTKYSTALVELSHREKAWTQTEKSKPISYEWAEELVAL